MNLNRLKIKHMINIIACFNFGTAFTLNLTAEQAEIATKSSKSGLLLAFEPFELRSDLTTSDVGKVEHSAR